MNFLVLLLMTICGALGGFFLKSSTNKVDQLFKLIKCRDFYLGGVFYCIGAILNIYLLKFIPYSIVMPLNALTYIWAFLLGVMIFKEKVNKNKVISIIFIIGGVILLSIQ